MSQGALPGTEENQANEGTTVFSLSGPEVPQRELRLLVDGIRQWLFSLTARGATPKCWGLIQGKMGRGQHEILTAMRDFSQRLGIQSPLSITNLRESKRPGD